jgi:hypothetical protein
MQKWEYQILKLRVLKPDYDYIVQSVNNQGIGGKVISPQSTSGVLLNEYLDEAGQEGWEAVGLTTAG